MGTACAVIILICLCSVGAASAGTRAYISTAACFIRCRPLPLAQHPQRVFVGSTKVATNVRWTHWDSGTAIGRGELLFDTGIKLRVTLKVSHLVSCDDRKVYSRLEFETPVQPMTKSALEFDINGCVLVAPGT
jgi:hypothetical protein